MAQIQQNGSDVTGNYFQGTSTKNKGGSVVGAGSSLREKSLKSSNPYVGAFNSIVANSESIGNGKAILAGNFANTNSSPLSVGITSKLAGVNSIFKAANAINLGVNKIDRVITNNITTTYRNSDYNVYTNMFLSPILNTDDNFGSDKAINNKNFTTYQIGNNKPFNNQIHNSISINTTIPINNNFVSPSPTPTITITPTASQPVSIIMTNSANYNNCGGNLANIGTSGRSSYYGTYDMSGNIWEWLETSVGGNSKVLRGGNFEYGSNYIDSTSRSFTDKNTSNYLFGFRMGAKTLSSLYTNVRSVSDINNTSDSNGYGSVNYVFYIGTYEVTNNEYVEFLNSIAKTDTYAVYESAMGWSNLGGITRSGSPGNYQYVSKANMGNKPVNFVNWLDCARYCNWLTNNKPVGDQTSSTTENGTYDLSLSNPVRNSSANFFIPNENEWYKAAFYKGGSINAGYWLYATQNNTPPNCVSLTVSGDGIPV